MNLTYEQIWNNWNHCVRKSNDFMNLKEIRFFFHSLVYEHRFKREIADKIQNILYEKNIIPFKFTYNVKDNGIKFDSIENSIQGDLYSLMEMIFIVYNTAYIDSDNNLIIPK